MTTIQNYYSRDVSIGYREPVIYNRFGYPIGGGPTSFSLRFAQWQTVSPQATIGWAETKFLAGPGAPRGGIYAPFLRAGVATLLFGTLIGAEAVNSGQRMDAPADLRSWQYGTIFNSLHSVSFFDQIGDSVYGRIVTFSMGFFNPGGLAIVSGHNPPGWTSPVTRPLYQRSAA